jgi:peptidyl-prolyl cis-trans isomerase SurA
MINKYYPKKFLSTIFLLTAVIGLNLGIIKAMPATQTLDRVVAIINQGVITERQLDHYIQSVKEAAQFSANALPQSVLKNPADLRRFSLDHMIDTALQLQFAQENKLNISNTELDQTIQQIAQENKLSVAEFRKELENQGKNWSVYKNQLKQQILLKQLQHLVLPQVHLNEKAVQQTLVQFPLTAGLPETYICYHLERLFIPNRAQSGSATTQSLKKARKQAENTLQKAQQGASLQQLAADNKQTKEKNSWKYQDLGWRRKAELPDFFIPQLKNLEMGQNVCLLQTDEGFNLIRLLETRVELPANQPTLYSTHTRHILLKKNTVLDDKALEKQLETIRETCLKQTENFADQAKHHSKDPISAIKGGDLGWLLPGSVASQFETQMEKLQPGQISAPFKTAQGWHIVQVLARKPLSLTDIEWRKQRIAKQLFQEKSAATLKQWLQDLRAQAYIRIMD